MTSTEVPTVSIILPTYNRGTLIAPAIDSVLHQTFTDFELIIIVDGSTDDTMQRLAPYRNRARIEYQANAGLGAARNHGLKLARSRYVAFIDDDDTWHPEKLRIQMEFFAAHPECSIVSVPAATIERPAVILDNALLLRDANGLVRRPFKHKAAGNLLISPCGIMIDRLKAPQASFYPVRGCLEDITLLAAALSLGELGIAGDTPLIFINEGSAGSLGAAANSWILARSHMRSLLATGKLGPRHGELGADIRALVGYIGRMAAMRCLNAGRPRDAACIYCREIHRQILLGRIRFIIGFPILLALHCCRRQPEATAASGA
ncbi:MAG: glycosyltransferase family 2 protein [Phycisphaerales bacterium]|nr:glycosyltransferase family 2 protein [Phycisphaerales bacterium]